MQLSDYRKKMTSFATGVQHLESLARKQNMSNAANVARKMKSRLADEVTPSSEYTLNSMQKKSKGWRTKKVAVRKQEFLTAIFLMKTGTDQNHGLLSLLKLTRHSTQR